MPFSDELVLLGRARTRSTRRTSGRRPGASSTATTPWTRMYTDSRGRTIRHDPRMFRHDPTALRQAQGRHRRHGAGHWFSPIPTDDGQGLFTVTLRPGAVPVVGRQTASLDMDRRPPPRHCRAVRRPSE